MVDRRRSMSIVQQVSICLVAMVVSLPVHSAWFSDEQAIMGTRVSVTLWHDDERAGRKAIAAVMEEMRRIDRTLSPYKDTSDLSQMNRKAATGSFDVSDELAFLLDKSLYYGRVSDGAFDITFATVGRYYDYRNQQKPADAERLALLSGINYRHINFNKAEKRVSYAEPEVYIDLGGIAKGHAVDRAASILMAMGIKHATVSAGGDSRVIGDKRGEPWMIGIKNPRQKAGEYDSVMRIPLSDVAVSTSGDYERFFLDPKSGERIHHILNPKTGKSARGVVSVTVLGDRGVDTDPLSTTVFVLGVKKGLAFINAMPQFDCIIIDSQGVAHYSKGLVEPGVN